MPEVSVVLVNHNGAACLRDALSALRDGTRAADVECVVVDSGSSDGSWQGLDAVWDRVRVLRFEQNIGFCVGCNRGAEAARGRYVAFVNFDSRVEPGWDVPLRNALADPGVAVADCSSGPMARRSRRPAWRSRPTPRRTACSKGFHARRRAPSRVTSSRSPAR
jgi:GT2 family glycosyltransferase